MKTLYVSDLDGTLLRSNETTSEYTNKTINNLVEKGMFFSYATARSFQTAHKVTSGLNAKIPLIIYNGTMVVDNQDGAFLLKNFFTIDVKSLIDELIDNDIFPIVYSFMEGVEKFSFLPDKCSKGMKQFLATRKGDIRENSVQSISELYKGEIFYVTCIDDEQKLKPLFDKYKTKYHCVFQVDMYTGEQWFEIMPKGASKANAVKQLKELLGCEKVVVFGDGVNDIEMFEMADEAYAMENAVDELKQLATDVILSNDNDGVAKWLWENYSEQNGSGHL